MLGNRGICAAIVLVIVRLSCFASFAAPEFAEKRPSGWQEVPFNEYSPHLEVQELPAVAAGSNGFFVVWYDQRTSHAGLFGTRIDSHGTVLDPAGISISDRLSIREAKAVASDGHDFLVVYSAPSNSGRDSVVSAAFVRDGVAAPSFIIATNGTNLSVAFSRGVFLVTWSDGDIHAARVRGDGSVLDSFTVCSAPFEQSAPLVVGGEGEFLIAWRDYRENRSPVEMDLYGKLVSADRNISPTEEFQVARAAYLHAMARAGDRYLLSWSSAGWLGDFMRGTGPHISFIREGTITERRIDLNFGRSMYDAPALVAVPDGFWVLGWGTGHPHNQWHDIYALRFDANGVRITGEPVQLTSSYDWQRNCVAASFGTNVFVAWQHQPFHSQVDQDIYGTVLGDNGPQRMDGAPLALAAPRQLFPSVASNGRDYLMAWVDGRSNYMGSIVGARLNRKGRFLEETEIVFSPPVVLGANVAPAVASRRDEYLVAWLDWSAIQCRILKENGIQSREFSVPDEWPAGAPVLAGTRNGYLVAWTTRNRLNRFRVATATLSPEGDANRPVVDGVLVSDDPFHLAAAASSTDWLLLLTSQRHRSDRTLRGLLIEQRTGRRREMLVAGSGSESFVGSQPSVAWNGREFGIVWTESPHGTHSAYRVVFVTLGRNGDLRHGPMAFETPDWVGSSIILSHGGGFLVGWRQSTGDKSVLKGLIVRANGGWQEMRSLDADLLPASQISGTSRTGGDFLISICQQDDWHDWRISFRRFRR